ncbi:DUF397 domain-containing protein [Streptomyces chilikensis]|uniref:DUF397 domain-containing protein n=1 Tax=Streptomyces chilikensis TaxID=1194079 RepID=UPI000B195D6F|nr:DUF397 domain-containing protein [Streptomyces chilikensis]
MSRHPLPTPDLAKALWRASTYSGGQGECLEIADNAGPCAPVRDSKKPTGPVIVFGHPAWTTFTTHLVNSTDTIPGSVPR